MATLISEKLTRLQATALVSGAELSCLGRGEIIHHAAKDMARQALQKLLNDCIKTEQYQGHQGQTLYLDVYVLTPGELYNIIADARAEGGRDASIWLNRVP